VVAQLGAAAAATPQARLAASTTASLSPSLCSRCCRCSSTSGCCGCTTSRNVAAAGGGATAVGSYDKAVVFFAFDELDLATALVAVAAAELQQELGTGQRCWWTTLAAGSDRMSW
jgi:hypothetical protein